MSEEWNEMDLEIEDLDKLIMWLWFTFYIGFLALIVAGITSEISVEDKEPPAEVCLIEWHDLIIQI